MYESSDTAKDAWDTACENCTGNKTVAGIQMKYEDGVIASDPFVAFAAVCGNVSSQSWSRPRMKTWVSLATTLVQWLRRPTKRLTRRACPDAVNSAAFVLTVATAHSRRRERLQPTHEQVTFGEHGSNLGHVGERRVRLGHVPGEVLECRPLVLPITLLRIQLDECAGLGERDERDLERRLLGRDQVAGLEGTLDVVRPDGLPRSQNIRSHRMGTAMGGRAQHAIRPVAAFDG